MKKWVFPGLGLVLLLAAVTYLAAAGMTGAWDQRGETQQSKAYDLRAKTLDLVGDVERCINESRWDDLIGLIAEDARLVLVKEGKVYLGPKEIVGYWQSLKPQQKIVRVRLEAKTGSVGVAAEDVLRREPAGGGAYVIYDASAYVFGTYTYEHNPAGADTGDLYFEGRHQHVCLNKVGLIVLD